MNNILEACDLVIGHWRERAIKAETELAELRKTAPLIASRPTRAEKRRDEMNGNSAEVEDAADNPSDSVPTS